MTTCCLSIQRGGSIKTKPSQEIYWASLCVVCHRQVLDRLSLIPKNAFDEHCKPQPDGGVQYRMNAIEIELDLVFP